MCIKKAPGFGLQSLDASSTVTTGTDKKSDLDQAGKVLDAEIFKTSPGVVEFGIEVSQVRHRPRHKHQSVVEASISLAMI